VSYYADDLVILWYTVFKGAKLDLFCGYIGRCQTRKINFVPYYVC